MASLNKAPYFCLSCKKVYEKLSELIVVEEELKRTFCNETCLLNYFDPVSEIIDKKVTALKKTLGVNDEPIASFAENSEVIQEVLDDPDEMYKAENGLGESLYSFVKTINKDDKTFFGIVICYLFKGAPSFVLSHFLTSSQELVEHFREGEPVENLPASGSNSGVFPEGSSEGKVEEINLTPEDIEQLDYKKSKVLAKLLEVIKDTDIGLESYPVYEKYLPLTIENPDEIYKDLDEDGDERLVYLKNFQEDQINFFYIVVCLKLERKELSQEILVPVFSFPSLDLEIYKEFRTGERISGAAYN